MTPLIRDLVSLNEDVALSRVWFDLGRLPRFEFAWSDIPGSRLPFPECAIVGRDGKNDRFLLYAEQADETAILLYAWAFTSTGPKECTPIFAVVMDSEKGGCYIYNVEGEQEITKAHAAPIVGILAEFLRAANPTGYRAEPKRNSITNARRAKHGKPPLIYDWHTVVIEPPQPKGEHQGGTHASPRQHDRRGHWRTCANGSRVWVRSCVVGNPALGAVFKDYRVSA